MAKVEKMTRTRPVYEGRELIGLVAFDGFGGFVKVAGKLHVPSSYQFRTGGNDESDEPLVTLEYTVSAGGDPECMNFSIQAKPHGRRVMRRDFDTVAARFHDWTGWAYKAVMHTSSEADEGFALGSNVDPIAATKATSESRKRANRKITDSVKRETARIYRENIQGAPRKAVADRFGIADQTAAHYIRAARDEGYIPETTVGKKKA